MAKQTITITVDSDVIEQVRQLRINMSATINEYLESLLRKYDEDVDGINIRLERIRLEKITKKLNHWQNQFHTTKAKIEKYEEVKKEKEEERLEKQKEEIENQKRCSNCKEIKAEIVKMHEFGKLQICDSCYKSAKPSDIKRWME